MFSVSPVDSFPSSVELSDLPLDVGCQLSHLVALGYVCATLRHPLRRPLGPLGPVSQHDLCTVLRRSPPPTSCQYHLESQSDPIDLGLRVDSLVELCYLPVLSSSPVAHRVRTDDRQTVLGGP